MAFGRAAISAANHFVRCPRSRGVESIDGAPEKFAPSMNTGYRNAEVKWTRRASPFQSDPVDWIPRSRFAPMLSSIATKLIRIGPEKLANTWCRSSRRFRWF